MPIGTEVTFMKHGGGTGQTAIKGAPNKWGLKSRGRLCYVGGSSWTDEHMAMKTEDTVKYGPIEVDERQS